MPARAGVPLSNTNRHPHPWKKGEGAASGWAGSGGLLFGLLQPLQVVGGALRMRRGREDRALVLLQDLQPVAKIGGVVVADLWRDAEVSTEKGGAQLGDKLFEGVGVIPKALAEFPRLAAFVAGPADQLVRLGTGVALGVLEGLGRGQLDEVAGG